MTSIVKLSSSSTLRLFVLFLLLIGGLSLTACDGGDNDDNNGPGEFEDGNDEEENGEEEDEESRLFGNTAVSLHDNYEPTLSPEINSIQTTSVFTSDQRRLTGHAFLW